MITLIKLIKYSLSKREEERKVEEIRRAMYEGSGQDISNTATGSSTTGGVSLASVSLNLTPEERLAVEEMKKRKRQMLEVNLQKSQQSGVGGLKVSVKSKYQEDQLRGEHSKIWGSFYEEGKWGYGCCKKTDKNDMTCG